MNNDDLLDIFYTSKTKWLADNILSAIYVNLDDPQNLDKLFYRHGKLLITSKGLEQLETNLSAKLATLHLNSSLDRERARQEIADEVVDKLVTAYKSNQYINFSNLASWAFGSMKRRYLVAPIEKPVDTINDIDLARFKELVDSESNNYYSKEDLSELYDMLDTNQNKEGLPIFRRKDSSNLAKSILFKGKKIVPSKVNRLTEGIINPIIKEDIDTDE